MHRASRTYVYSIMHVTPGVYLLLSKTHSVWQYSLVREHAISPMSNLSTESWTSFIWRKIVPGKRVTLFIESTLATVYVRMKLLRLTESTAFSLVKTEIPASFICGRKQIRNGTSVFICLQLH